MFQLKRVMEDDANKLRAFKPYNILPLESPGVANAFEYIPEVGVHTTQFSYSLHKVWKKSGPRAVNSYSVYLFSTIAYFCIDNMCYLGMFYLFFVIFLSCRKDLVV